LAGDTQANLLVDFVAGFRQRKMTGLYAGENVSAPFWYRGILQAQIGAGLAHGFRYRKGCTDFFHWQHTLSGNKPLSN
jgi:hypothetical protein